MRRRERAPSSEPPLSLYHLLDPEVLANPYPLYRRLRDEAPVHWDPYLHAWVVTRYEDVVTVLRRFSRGPHADPEQLAALGMEELAPIAAVMVRQMLFLDAPEHRRVRKARLRGVHAAARRAPARAHPADRATTSSTRRPGSGRFDVMAAIANPLPAIVTAEMLGVPTADHELLKDWSAGLRRDARQLPAQPRPRAQDAAERRGRWSPTSRTPSAARPRSRRRA